ncbi:conserved hypothetical protein [Hydrogenobacter thermophilus TK-6]|uniref:Cytochrome b561 domain-containing protein n=1 Tax=Hydrogenobacter thermophilus (strain DSM 6534 / IAM 12695 / TK-6) TaxID=608538 RepID=D3DJ04_HYDTT|nr:hypothetical protein [Hydrogenobacter thermophilus]ADO45731.1 conserved hypothetical protein [Hydrogenobacter thermophilus TK-6]BAI69806.1 hypothetical protein HTH_1355 [Hydrogenobacter thermophilus TK-6]GBC88851.1 hypothetical protein HRbin13_00982 [bacterium HR13]
MILHPLFAYTTILLSLIVFVLYALSLTLLKNSQAFRYALVMHGFLILVSLIAVLAGFSVSNVPLVQSKAPGVWLFPHKWNGIFLFVYTLLSFLLFWFKGADVGRKGIYVSVLGILIVMFQLFTGWMIRLVFFS